MRSSEDKNRHLLSLDALRGFDMLFIMGGEAFVISLLSLFPEDLYATAYWGCYILVCWLFLYFLYRCKLFLKV